MGLVRTTPTLQLGRPIFLSGPWQGYIRHFLNVGRVLQCLQHVGMNMQYHGNTGAQKKYFAELEGIGGKDKNELVNGKF